MDLVGRHDGDVLDETMADPAARAETGIVDQLDGEFDILRRERRAVVPFHVAAQLDLPGQAVGREAAILDGRDFAGEVGNEFPVGLDVPERREHLPPDALIDLDARHQGMKDSRLLRQRRDHLAARLVRGIGRTFGLCEGVP